jgi:hypothetical protein
MCRKASRAELSAHSGGRCRRPRASFPGALLAFALVAPGLAAPAAPDAGATVALPDRPVYGRVATPIPAAGSVSLSLGASNRISSSVVIVPGQPGRCEAMADGTTRLWTCPLPDGARRIEFSNGRGIFRLYTDRRLLGTITNAAPYPPGMSARWPGETPRVSLQRIEPVHASDDFMREQIARDDAWFVQSGLWRNLYDPTAAAAPNPFVCVGQAEREAALLTTGYVFWNNLRVAVSVLPQGLGPQGIVFACRDATNYLAAAVSRESGASVSLIEVRDGRSTVLGSRPIQCPARQWMRCEVRFSEGRPPVVALDGIPMLTGPADRNLFGKVGLLVLRGSAQFDDFETESWPPETPPPPRLIGAVSRLYSAKETSPQTEKADLQLFRWAKDTDAWQPLRAKEGAVPLLGKQYRLPIYGDFELRLPPDAVPGRLVLRGFPQPSDRTFPVPAADPAPLRRQEGEVRLGTAVLGRTGPRDPAYVGFARGDASGFSGIPELRSDGVIQELFDRAPASWLAIGGLWEITNRWKCQPSWKFFCGAGFDAAVLMSKKRFEGGQTHEVYFALKDLFGREYNYDRYARHDVNFSLCTDGLGLFSGYTLMYGGFGNRASYLYRGSQCVATNADVKFHAPIPDYDGRIYDEHLYWRRIRVDRVQNRVRALIEDRTIFDYEDPAPLPPDGGHIALWTYRNGVMWGRLDSSAERVVDDGAPYLALPSSKPDAGWQALDPDLVHVEREATGQVVRVANLFSGGEFAVRHPVPNHRVNLQEGPVLAFWLDAPAGVKVSLHFRVNGQSFVHALTAPVDQTYRVLGDPSTEPGRVDPDWKLYVSEALDGTRVAGQPQDAIRGWLRIPLLEEARKLMPGGDAYWLEELIVGNTSHAGYLMAGLSGNRAGAAYRLGPPSFER